MINYKTKANILSGEKLTQILKTVSIIQQQLILDISHLLFDILTLPTLNNYTTLKYHRVSVLINDDRYLIPAMIQVVIFI